MRVAIITDRQDVFSAIERAVSKQGIARIGHQELAVIPRGSHDRSRYDVFLIEERRLNRLQRTERRSRVALKSRPSAASAGAVPDFGAVTRLTRRQYDIVKLVLLGKTNKQIARSLDISDNTVRNHLVSIFRLLGVSTRMQLSARVQP